MISGWMKPSTVKMMKKRSALIAWPLLALLPCLILMQCDLVDPVAPDGATMTLYANPTTISIIGGVSEITAIITESDGYPVPDGTVINMVSDLGRLEYNQMNTNNGTVHNQLHSEGVGGTATITAYSGVLSEITTTVEIGITPSAVAVSADPQFLPPGGGQSQIKAVVFDEDFIPMPNVSVSMSTSAGALQSGGAPLVTDADGTVRDLLTTEETADVIASVSDAVTGQTTVVVDNRYAHTLYLTANPGSVNTCDDHGDHVEIIAYCLDASGFPAEGSLVIFALEGEGWISNTSGVANSNGEIAITFGLTDGNCSYCASPGNNCSAKITAISGPDAMALVNIEINLN
jgi:hypothetical protein